VDVLTPNGGIDMTDRPDPLVAVDQVSKHYPARSGHGPVHALDRVSLRVEPGEIVCVVGPSGCGKTTLLNLLAGFEDVSGGTVAFDGRPITGPHADRGVVFQEAALFPWLSARDNIGFGLRERRLPRATRRRITDEYLEMVGLDGAGERLPAALSGGMRQRVALARALANGAQLLLLDEPFAALDEQTKSQMHGELLRIWRETGTTMVLITHSIDEAVLLADRGIAMAPRPGRIMEEIVVDLPRPRDDTSAAFNDLKRHVRSLITAAMTTEPVAS